MLFPVINTQNWLDNAFNDFFDTSAMRHMNATAPAVNVKSDTKAYTMEMAVPGIKKEFCRVNLNSDGDLVVAIENKLEHHEQEGKGNHKSHYLRREFSYTNYQQVYTLPEDVDKEHIEAHVADGVLTITLPKVVKPEAKAERMIEIH